MSCMIEKGELKVAASNGLLNTDLVICVSRCVNTLLHSYMN